MIESKILGSAPGIQRQDVIDKSETTVLPSLTNGVITGRFKRGRMDKPFKLTASNYKALLGHDPFNPSYLAVEDCFKRGVGEVGVLRIGGSGSVDNGGVIGGGTGGVIGGGDLPPPIRCIPVSASILYDSGWNDRQPVGSELHARYRVNDGQWVDYKAPITGNDNGYVRDLFNTIKTSTGRAMIETSGNDYSFAPFRSYQGRSELTGASNSEPYSSGQRGVNEDVKNKIEFVVTQNNYNDVVYLAFGKSVTVYSCAVGSWVGL